MSAKERRQVLYGICEICVAVFPLLRTSKDTPFIALASIMLASRWMIYDEEENNLPMFLKTIYFFLIGTTVLLFCFITFCTQYKELSNGQYGFSCYDDIIFVGGNEISYTIVAVISIVLVIAATSKDLVYVIIKKTKERNQNERKK